MPLRKICSRVSLTGGSPSFHETWPRTALLPRPGSAATPAFPEPPDSLDADLISTPAAASQLRAATASGELAGGVGHDPLELADGLVAQLEMRGADPER